MSAPDTPSILLSHIGKLEGQLAMMTQLMQQNHESTHQRINDFRHAIEGRVIGVESRVERVEDAIEKVEDNERALAIKSAGGGAFSGAIAAAAVELIKFLATRS